MQGAYNARQTDAALPTAETSSPQTAEAGATRQPAESASRAFSSGHNTTTEPMARTGNLRRRPSLTTLDSSVTAPPALPLPTSPSPEPHHQVPPTFHNIGTTAWLSNLARRKLQTATSPLQPRPGERDTLLRRVMLRNSITRVDLALAEAQEWLSRDYPVGAPHKGRIAEVISKGVKETPMRAVA